MFIKHNFNKATEKSHCTHVQILKGFEYVLVLKSLFKRFVVSFF